MSRGAVAPRRVARVGVVVPAAGLGHRMGGVRKAFLEVAGEPCLLHALRPFLEDPRVDCMSVALAPDDARDPPAWLRALGPRVVVVPGGATRSQSVRSALAALPPGLDVIAVHDAARPLVTRPLVAHCIDLALEGYGAVVGCPAVDTMKRVAPDRRVVETPAREGLWHAHTPQVFPAEVLRAAYADPTAEGTDDAELVERVGADVAVQMVDAGWSNIKITSHVDVALVETILRLRRVEHERMGEGGSSAVANGR